MTSTSTKIALTLSGGGYRATLFALGALQRLNESGLLSKINTITSVSGGSIASGVLAKNWGRLAFNETGSAENFNEEIAIPIRKFCTKNVDIKSVLSGLFSYEDTIGDKIAKAYRDLLFADFTLKDINKHQNAPLFIFYGTNYQTGASIRLSQHYISDWRIGINELDDIPLAKVVGISSAFPPFMSPVTLKLKAENWKKTEYATHFDNNKLKSHLLLTDGGLYDNLGLEAVTKNNEYQYVLCCDAGAPFDIKTQLKTNWLSQFLRMTNLMINQQRALRKRNLFSTFEDKKLQGTYFGIGSKISDRINRSVIPFTPKLTDSATTSELQNIRTRLKGLSKATITDLVLFGDAMCDASIKCWCAELEE